MKIFCQHCGDALSDSVLICPKCGFVNKIPGKINRRRSFIVSSIFIVLLGSGFVLFRDELTNHYSKIFKTIKIGAGGITINADTQEKENFKLAFAEYEYAEFSFETGFPDYEKLAPEIEHLYEKQKIEDKSFFMREIMKREDDMQISLSMEERDLVKRTKDEIREALNNCGQDRTAFQKCQEYRELIDKYPPQKCKDCDAKISELYKAASAINDSNIAAKLLGLVDLLRQQQAFYDDEEFIQLHDWIFDQEYCVAAQNLKWREVKNMSETEIKNVVASKDAHKRDVSLVFIEIALTEEGKQFNKNNTLEKIEENRMNCSQRGYEYQAQLDEKQQIIDGNTIRINDYIAMINGSLNLDLKTWKSAPMFK